MPTKKTSKRKASRKKQAPARTRENTTATGRSHQPDQIYTTRRRYTPVGALDCQVKPNEASLGFRSASFARENGDVVGGSHDWHAQTDRRTMIHQSRGFDRDNVFYAALLNRAVNAIMGPKGFIFDLNTKDERVNADAKRLFREWGRDPEVRGLWAWNGLQKMQLRETLAAGDILNIKIRSKRQLQMIEAERIHGGSDEYSQGGNQGVRKNKWGRAEAYGVGNYGLGGAAVDTSNVKWIDAKDSIFMYNIVKRTGQTRGMPALQESFPNFHRLRDILDAEATAWDRLSRFAVGVMAKDAADKGQLASVEDSTKTNTDGHLTDRVSYVDQGTFFWGEPGEDLKGIEQNRPNQHFYESVKTFLRLITMAIGMPVEYLLFDFEKANFSQSRSTLTLAYFVFRDWQQLLIRLFHRRVWNWLAGTWVLDGSLQIPKSMDFKDLLRYQQWHVPAFPWVDPLKEAQAWEKQMGIGLTTHTEALAAQGRDRDEQNDQREHEIKDAIDRAKKLTKETGVPVDWRMFAGLETGKTERAAMVTKGNPITITTPDDDEDDDNQGDADGK